jgi:hypothetical protein
LARRERLTAPAAIFYVSHYRDLRERVLQGGTDEEILNWCFENGRRPNEGDIFVWNGFASKLGWRDFATPTLEQAKEKAGYRIATISQPSPI